MNENMRTIAVSHSSKQLSADILEESLRFEVGKSPFYPISKVREPLLSKFDNPMGCIALNKQINRKDKILILIEDNTWNAPAQIIIPILIGYLRASYVPLHNIEIRAVSATHGIITEEELIDKVGTEVYKKVKVSQYDFSVQLNKKAHEADYIIGLHITIPPGAVQNPYYKGMEMVAGKIGIKFIINVVMALKGEVADIFTGDFAKAHREGAKLSARLYGVEIPEQADIVVDNSFPCDID